MPCVDYCGQSSAVTRRSRHDKSTVTIPFMSYFEFADERIRSTHVYIDIAPLFAEHSSK